MKIAICLWSLVGEGGAQREAVYLASKLAGFGHEVTFYTLLYSPQNPFQSVLSNVPVKFLHEYKFGNDEHTILFGNKKKRHPLIQFLEWTRAVNDLSKRLAALIDADTDIINVHDKTFKVANFFKKNNKKSKSVWMMNDLPLSQWNSERFEIHEAMPKRILRWVSDQFEIPLMRKLDAIVVLDNMNKRIVSRYLQKDAFVIRSGLDISEFSGNPRLLSYTPPLKLLMIGIFSVHRRFEDGIEALALLRNKGIDASLDIVGPYGPESSYKKSIDVMVKEKNLEPYIHFFGSVSEAQLLHAYQTNHIFLFPNHNQTWGLSVFEAMAMGIPVIVSRTTGASEMVEDGVTACIVDPKSPQQIAQKIEWVMDPQHYEMISKNAYAFARKHISWDAYAEQMEVVFKKLVE